MTTHLARRRRPTPACWTCAREVAPMRFRSRISTRTEWHEHATGSSTKATSVKRSSGLRRAWRRDSLGIERGAARALHEALGRKDVAELGFAVGEITPA
jgi:hypothetical protein